MEPTNNIDTEIVEALLANLKKPIATYLRITSDGTNPSTINPCKIIDCILEDEEALQLSAKLFHKVALIYEAHLNENLQPTPPKEA